MLHFNWLTDQNQTTLQGLLETASSTFYHYRIEVQSDRLWSEIKYVLQNFADPLTKLFQLSCSNIAKYQTDINALTQTFHTINLELQLFYSLNFQDIPEYFEDNMNLWMGAFVTLLIYSNNNIKAHDEPSVIDIVHTSICECVQLYATKYEDKFKPFIATFVEKVWNLLQSTNTNKRFDNLVTAAIKFLIAIVKKEWQIYEHILFLFLYSISFNNHRTLFNWLSKVCLLTLFGSELRMEKNKWGYKLSTETLRQLKLKNYMLYMIRTCLEIINTILLIIWMFVCLM
jgi:hypothetical protein